MPQKISPVVLQYLATLLFSLLLNPQPPCSFIFRTEWVQEHLSSGHLYRNMLFSKKKKLLLLRPGQSPRQYPTPLTLTGELSLALIIYHTMPGALILKGKVKEVMMGRVCRTPWHWTQGSECCGWEILWCPVWRAGGYWGFWVLKMGGIWGGGVEWGVVV